MPNPTSYAVGTITGAQAGLSTLAIIENVEWESSIDRIDRREVSGEVYKTDFQSPLAEVRITARVPRQYSNIPAAGGSITVKGGSFGDGAMSLDLDSQGAGMSFHIADARVVSSNNDTATVEIEGFRYLREKASTTYDWILTDEHPAEDEYKNTIKFSNPDPTKYAFAITFVTMRRTTQTKTWRKAIPADQAAPVRPNPGNLSPTGWDTTHGRVGRWVCIDGGCSRPYFLNGEIVKEAFVTWQYVSDWAPYHSDYTEEKEEESSSNA